MALLRVLVLLAHMCRGSHFRVLQWAFDVEMSSIAPFVLGVALLGYAFKSMPVSEMKFVSLLIAALLNFGAGTTMLTFGLIQRHVWLSAGSAGPLTAGLVTYCAASQMMQQDTYRVGAV